MANSDNTGNRTSEYETNKNREKTDERWQEQSQFEFSGYGKNMENTRRSLWTWSFEQGKNGNEVEEENANQFERSSEASRNGIPYTNGTGLQGLRSERELRESQKERTFGWERWWELEPNVGRVAHGVSQRVDRLKGLGNSLVPTIPFIIGNSILETEENNECI